LSGGVAFETEDLQAPVLARRVPRFNLFESREAALRNGLAISIRVDRADGLSPGTAIRYRGLDVGSVDSIELGDDLQSVILRARVTLATQQIARVGTQFWVVKPELSLTRVTNLDTLVSGQYLEVLPANKAGAKQTEFVALTEPPNQTLSELGLRLVLSAARRSSLKTGVPVTYREVPVGKVTGYELGQTADRVLIHLLIEPRYAGLVRTGSRFWSTSGIGVEAGLFKGVKVHSESLETIIEGGVAFATPEEPTSNQARPGQTFALFDEPQDEWLLWAPKITLPK
jgi:paraquat-inducible protein B